MICTNPRHPEIKCGYRYFKQGMMADALAPPLPRRIAHYDIFNDRELGRGTFGYVCVGRDTRDNSVGLVAIKRVEIRNRRSELDIGRELSALQSISHPHITTLLYHGRIGNYKYFVLELCSKNLQRFAQENIEFCNLKMQFTHEFALAVQCLHANNIIHRDIKPENVLVKLSEGSWITKLSDLGLSCYIPEGIGSASFFATGGVGTLPWMAPEVMDPPDGARYSKAADRFSLGLLNLSVADHRPGEELKPPTGIIDLQ